MAQNIGGSTFGQKVEEKLNPSQNWQHQIHAAALAQKSDPMTMLGFVVGNKLLNPIMTNWLNAKFRPKDKTTGTTVTGATNNSNISSQSPISNESTENVTNPTTWEEYTKNANAENYDLTGYADELLKNRTTPKDFGKNFSLLG